MKSLTRLLAIPILAIATLLPLDCTQPVQSSAAQNPDGIVDVNFPKGPYSYSIEVFEDNSVVGE